MSMGLEKRVEDLEQTVEKIRKVLALVMTHSGWTTQEVDKILKEYENDNIRKW